MLKIVILNQNISDWGKKGELQNNYFNFQKRFKSLIIISLGKYPKPSNKILQTLCGTDNYSYYSFQNFILNHKFLKYLLPSFAYKILIFRELKNLNLPKPKLLLSVGDCYCGFISGIIASYLKSSLVVSIHTYESLKVFICLMSFKEKIFFLLNKRFKKKSHANASRILVVYDKIKENIDPINKKKVFVEYNKIDIPSKNKKTRFEINKSVNLVFVGRLIKGKSLLNILHAIRRIKNVNLTVFGDGPQRNKIEQFISHYNLKKRVIIKGFVDNKIIISSLKKYDAFVAFHKYHEFPKTIIESILIGLPIILNKNPSSKLKEFKKLEILWAEDSSDSYLKIMKNFLKKYYNTKKISQKNLFKLQEIINAR